MRLLATSTGLSTTLSVSLAEATLTVLPEGGVVLVIVMSIDLTSLDGLF
jgi:hypothetical protein